MRKFSYRRKEPKPPPRKPLPPLPPPTPEDFARIALASRYADRSYESKIAELRMLWRNAAECHCLTAELRRTLADCARFAENMEQTK